MWSPSARNVAGPDWGVLGVQTTHGVSYIKMVTLGIYWTEEVVSCSVISDSATPWTVDHQIPMSMEFSRQEHWSGLPFPSPGLKKTDHSNQFDPLVSVFTLLNVATRKLLVTYVAHFSFLMDSAAQVPPSRHLGHNHEWFSHCPGPVGVLCVTWLNQVRSCLKASFSLECFSTVGLDNHCSFFYSPVLPAREAFLNSPCPQAGLSTLYFSSTVSVTTATVCAGYLSSLSTLLSIS